ncbi:unnamed protein product, partial [Mesorhabditis belari]|uniref:Ig-like domain-containing protein n=1 Tax=Mesorhabditis belari TaxID=2138241 RepID=A0AAF3FFR5_9BILA
MWRLIGLAALLLYVESTRERTTPYNWQMGKDFDSYDKCIRNLANTTNVASEVLLVRRNGVALLNCFPCLYPEDELFVREVFKADKSKSEQFFGNFLSHAKTLLLGHQGPNLDRWKNEWFFLFVGKQQWTQLTNNYPSPNIGIHIEPKKLVKIILGLGSGVKYGQGSAYQLRISNVSREDIGYYKCARSGRVSIDGTAGNIENMYFLDIFVDREEKVQDFLDKNVTKTPEEKAMERDFSEVKTIAKATPWSRCNKCGNKIGEAVRTVECHFIPSVPLDDLPPRWKHLRLFRSIPCSSTLVPIEYIECESEEHAARIFRARDQFGKSSLLETIPGGEYVFGELLPRLKSPVHRQIMNVYNGDEVILPCKFEQDYKGYFWMANYAGDLTTRVLPEKKQNRAFIDGAFNLVFKSITHEDQDEYRCVDENGHLVAVYYVNIGKTEKEIEILKVSQMLTQFFSFVLVLILLFKIVQRDC